MDTPEVSQQPSGTEQPVLSGPTQQPTPTPSPTFVSTTEPATTQPAETQQPSPTESSKPMEDEHTEMLVSHETRIAELEAAVKHPANLHVTEIVVNLQNELQALKAKLRHMI